MSRRVFSLALSLVIFSWLAAVVLAADSDIVISEIMINAFVEEIGGNWGEWIEIYNKGVDPVDLTDWAIQDNFRTDVIDAAMCPGGSCIMPAGACWLIAVTAVELQSEFKNYTNPNQPSVDANNTIFLGGRPGNGLANELANGLDKKGDRLVLQDDSGTVIDCYSWDMLGTCSDDGPHVGSNGQSVTNVQGTWYNHQLNGSPYNCVNSADGGPTAVSLQQFNAHQTSPSVVLAVLASIGGLATVVFIRRRKAGAPGIR